MCLLMVTWLHRRNIAWNPRLSLTRELAVFKVNWLWLTVHWQSLTVHRVNWLCLTVHRVNWLCLTVHRVNWLSLTVHWVNWLYLFSSLYFTPYSLSRSCYFSISLYLASTALRLKSEWSDYCIKSSGCSAWHENRVNSTTGEICRAKISYRQVDTKIVSTPLQVRFVG